MRPILFALCVAAIALLMVSKSSAHSVDYLETWFRVDVSATGHAVLVPMVPLALTGQQIAGSLPTGSLVQCRLIAGAPMEIVCGSVRIQFTGLALR